MKLKVNGEEYLTEKAPIMQLLAEMGIVSGRLAYRTGRIPKKLYATASSPIEGVL